MLEVRTLVGVRPVVAAAALVGALALTAAPADAQILPRQTPLAEGSASRTGGQAVPDSVEITWDAYGVPHIVADSDELAYFGVGYATAELRLFQMHWHRLMYEGRLAEFFGPGTWTNPNTGAVSDVYIDHDRKARVLGWRRYADAVVADLASQPPGSVGRETFRMLQAYADGVNRSIATTDAFHPLFATYQVPVEPWTPADSVGIWIRMGQFFGPSGLDEAAKLKTYQDLLTQGASEAEILESLYGQAVCNDDAPVVKQGDVPQAVQDDMFAYAAALGLDASGNCPLGAGTPQFSEAWAVAGSQVTTGRAVVVGEPRITVYVPNSFVEWHVRGATFEVRGAGFPGSPNVLVGSTPHMAWGVTALGMDQADLFRLTTDPVGHPDEYQLDGVWRPWDVDVTETLLVQDKKLGAIYPSQSVRYRESWWGPVVTELANQTQGEEFSRKAKPFDDTSAETTGGFLAMFRATTLEDFSAALDGWSFPSVNIVFGSDTGRVGYRANGHMPVREPGQPHGGVVAMDGSLTAHDWVDRLHQDLLPWVHDPASGFVHSGNHMTIGSWYPIPNRPGPAGETHRSRRLREALEALPVPAAPNDIGRIHANVVVSTARDMTILGLHVRDVQQGAVLSALANQSLLHLELWLAAGATMDNSHYATLLAHRMPAYFREDSVGTAMINAYGGGDSGMSFWLESALFRIGQGEDLDANEVAYVVWTLEEAWNEMAAELTAAGEDPDDVAGWQSWYTLNVQTPALPRWTTLGTKPDLPLEPTPFQAPTLLTVHGNTISHQTGQSYSQFVEVGKVNGALAVLPPGQAENGPGLVAHQEDQVGLWALGALRPSPTTAAGIAALGPHRTETVVRLGPAQTTEP